MSYSDVQARYRELKVQFDAGTLSEDDFKAQLEELMFQDERGRWWILGYETGDWYVYEGEEWVRAEPPERTIPPVAQPTHGTPAEPPEALPAAELPTRQASVELQAAPPPVVELPIHRFPAERQEAPPVAKKDAPRLHQLAPKLKDGRGTLMERLKVPWIPWLIMTAGWGLGAAHSILWLPYSASAMILNHLLYGLVGGVATMWACRWPPNRTWHWSKAVILAGGWGIIFALASYLRISPSRISLPGHFVAETVGAFAGGLLTAAVLRWAGESLSRGQMAMIAGRLGCRQHRER